MFSTLFTFVPLALAVVGATADSSRPRAVHNGVASRPSDELAKRYASARWTFYDVGLGACGETNVADDFIVALNADQFGAGYPGTHCFKKIQMTYNGKSATATVMDRCPGCPYGGLDLSRGLFSHFDSEDKGVIFGEWSFVGEGAAPAHAPATTKAAFVAPTTTTKAQAAPTTHHATSHSKKTAPVTISPVVVATDAHATPSPSSSPSSSSKKDASEKAPTTSAPAVAVYSASLAAASSSVASLASTFSALAPSATANATATGAGATNTTAQIENNLNEINALIAKLGELIMTAALNSNSTN